jgi:hypothetical protein
MGAAQAQAVRGTPGSGSELHARLEAARREARAALTRSLDLHVAAHTTLAASAELLAHALPDIGPLTATHGVTMCDLLAGAEVVLVPGLEWHDVSPEDRCAECSRGVDSVVGGTGGRIDLRDRPIRS